MKKGMVYKNDSFFMGLCGDGFHRTERLKPSFSYSQGMDNCILCVRPAPCSTECGGLPDNVALSFEVPFLLSSITVGSLEYPVPASVIETAIAKYNEVSSLVTKSGVFETDETMFAPNTCFFSPKIDAAPDVYRDGDYEISIWHLFTLKGMFNYISSNNTKVNVHSTSQITIRDTTVDALGFSRVFDIVYEANIGLTCRAMHLQWKSGGSYTPPPGTSPGGYTMTYPSVVTLLPAG